MTQVTQQLSQRDIPGFPGIMNSFPLEGKEHKTHRALPAPETAPYGGPELLLSRSEINATPALHSPTHTLDTTLLGSLQRGKSALQLQGGLPHLRSGLYY